MLHNQMGWLEEHLECHVMTFRDRGIRNISKILVLIASEVPDELKVGTAEHLARVNNAEITFLGISNNSSPDNCLEKIKSNLLLQVEKMAVKCSVETLDPNAGLSEVIQKTIEFDLLVLNAKKRRSFRDMWFGNFDDRIMTKSACSVVSLQRRV